MARMPELSSSVTSPTAEAEQVVDFFLVENALGAALGGLRPAAVVDHGGPLRRPSSSDDSSAAAASARPAAGSSDFQRQAPFGGQRVLVDLVVVAP